MTHHHPQVLIELDDTSAYVDEGIAELLRTLWQMGFDTIASCEAFRPAWNTGWFGRKAYVVFYSEEDYELFARVVGSACGPRVMRMTPDDELRRELADPANRDEMEAKGAGWGVFFPSTAIPQVLGRLTELRAASRKGES